MVHKAWRIIPRPLLETVLNNHSQHHRLPQPLILHGPRGVGKTTLILERLLADWNKAPHLSGYVDFAETIKDHHPIYGQSFPWSSWSNCPKPMLSNCRIKLETCLESMAEKGVRLGSITSHQIFTTMNKWHGLNAALCRVIEDNNGLKSVRKVSSSVLWDRAVFALSARCNAAEDDGVLGLGDGGRSLSIDEVSYFREAIVALRLAKEVIRIQQGWRANAIADLNRTRGFSASLAHSCTDWPCLLIELLSQAAEIDHFQPKLIINNIDVLQNASLSEDDTSVCGSMYHDSLLWRLISLGANERCLPVILVTSNSYYSYRAYMDFGFPDIFISRETFGWNPQGAKLHMVPDYFSDSEWKVIIEVIGPNPRHLFELYALKQSNYYQKTEMDDNFGSIEDIVDAYLAYLQVTVVNPAMDRALALLKLFAADAPNGLVSKDKLRFGAPWRHPPQKDDPCLRLDWAKIQLMDFVESLVDTDFGVNYLADCSLEIFDDPAAVALVEVGLLYAQRDPSFMRPISRGIERCLVRWLVQQQFQLSPRHRLHYLWQRVIRGRSYRHLMLEVGYK